MDRTLGGGVPYLSREEIELLSEHSFSGGRAEVEPVDVSSLVSFDRCFYERLVETLRRGSPPSLSRYVFGLLQYACLPVGFRLLTMIC